MPGCSEWEVQQLGRLLSQKGPRGPNLLKHRPAKPMPAAILPACSYLGLLEGLC
jgi:hypothetical protein